jgi:tubby-related protein 1
MQQQQQQQAGRGGGAPPPPAGQLVGQPYLNTNAMLGLSQPTMVAARPTQEQQQLQNAQRVQAQLNAFGISALISPDAEQSTEDTLRLHGFAFDDAPLEGQLANFVPRRGLLRCYVSRIRTGVISTTQKFTLNVERGDKFMLSGRKRANKQTSNFLISLDADDLERQSQNFQGKVRANFTGTDFVIFDNGENPDKATSQKPARAELGAVLYATNIAGTTGPRKMTVVLPRRREDGQMEVWQPKTEADSIVNEYRNDPNNERFVVLVNKEPTWNEQLRSYQLNFHGRVSKASVKNFQLVDRRNPNRVVMQFGKKDDDRFSLDFQAPLNATQAFAIALTAFDNKIACE